MAIQSKSCSSRKTRMLLPTVMLAGATLTLRGLSHCFVTAPRSNSNSDPAALLGAAAALAPIQASFALLPPLEDLPMDEIAPTRSAVAAATPDTFMGITFQTWLLVLVGAVFWAATWVLNLKPAKDKDGAYKTYIGGGMLPPEGYTNPLDARMDVAVTDEEDELYSDELRPGATKGSKAASSAVV
eukprot:TRINITY_DN66_c0_g1_i1.p1 TRINITY_DN66_c0_g1~~TRINITY_DN66_c0_g1_i1.p1  ORF type:complete len:185 (+),score=46.36 TRINITY_DN66_c0_g1_i1:63-617(+)